MTIGAQYKSVSGIIIKRYANHAKQRKRRVDMVPRFIACYEELRVNDAVSLYKTAMPLKDRIRHIHSDNKIVVFWRRITGTGSFNIVTQHKDNQVRVADEDNLAFYSPAHYSIKDVTNKN